MSDQSYLRYNFMRRMRRNAVSCKKLPFCVPHRGPATGVIFHRICRLLFTCNSKLSVLLGPGVGQVGKIILKKRILKPSCVLDPHCKPTSQHWDRQLQFSPVEALSQKTVSSQAIVHLACIPLQKYMNSQNKVIRQNKTKI